MTEGYDAQACLLDALAKKNLKAVKEALSRGADPTAPLPGVHPWLRAVNIVVAQHYPVAFFDTLVRACPGKSAQQLCGRNTSFLDLALEHGNEGIFRHVIAQHWDGEIKVRTWKTLCAARKGHRWVKDLAALDGELLKREVGTIAAAVIGQDNQRLTNAFLDCVEVSCDFLRDRQVLQVAIQKPLAFDRFLAILKDRGRDWMRQLREQDRGLLHEVVALQPKEKHLQKLLGLALFSDDLHRQARPLCAEETVPLRYPVEVACLTPHSLCSLKVLIEHGASVPRIGREEERASYLQRVFPMAGQFVNSHWHEAYEKAAASLWRYAQVHTLQSVCPSRPSRPSPRL